MDFRISLPAVRIPVEKPVRLVGVSHSNNSYSLVDHASAADNFHHVAHILTQNVSAIVSDREYYKTEELKNEYKMLGLDVQELRKDRAFEETRNNYHEHFWKADHETENKFFIAKLSEVLHKIVEYKNTSCQIGRSTNSLDEHYITSMCNNHLEEIKNFRSDLEPYVMAAAERSAKIDMLRAPLPRERDWKEGTGPLDDPLVNRPIAHEITFASRETVGPRTDPPIVEGHRSGVKVVPSLWQVPDNSGRPGAANSCVDGTLTVGGRYGSRMMHERDLYYRRKPFEEEVRHVSSRFKHNHGLCE